MGVTSKNRRMPQMPSEPQENRVPTSFDLESRDRIRAAIRAYMKAHAIGVPTLLTRVMDADPRQREVSLPTMQRFVRGTHQSSDMVVGMCKQFLDKEGFAIPETPDDPLAGFETALRDFLIPPDTGGDAAGPVRGIAGRYQPAEQGFPSTRIEVSLSPSGKALRMTEEHLLGMVDVLHRYEGVLLARANQLFGMLRNELTMEPRVYWLHYDDGLGPDDDRELLVGEVRERPFKSPLTTGDKTIAASVRLTKQKAPRL